ncbi:MAG TPA: fibrobacter succinogenes major paralogous domain-containing protein [Bacteroidia bacterium]|jgi:uncharacterized protein (TIGR02145 family)|nr:fibrobacter succinogenes major paralogous domain-containing protein [Bacteroidia bacterium]
MKTIIITLIYITFFSYYNNPNDINSPATIGTQIWTSKNLDVSKFRNGDPIPEIESPKEFYQAGLDGKPAWCYYNGDASNEKKYGKLYNWYAAHDSRGIAPQGWHVPTDKEWSTLNNYLGGNAVAAKKVKTAIGWNGDNSSGFNALPAGYTGNGIFDGLGSYTCFWSVTNKLPTYVYTYSLGTNKAEFLQSYNNVARGFSIRCLKD